jgi:uncharacterized membrane protein (DUF106 family)
MDLSQLTTFINAYPHASIILISLGVTILITIVRYYMTDRVKMREIRERQKKLREEMKLYRDHPEKMMELNKKMLEDFPEQMRQSFKPMIITLIPVLVIFWWMKSVYEGTAIASTWFWWYIGASIIFSIILNKVFGLQ